MVLNKVQRAVQVNSSFSMYRNPVGPSLGKERDHQVWIFDHQVAVERQFRELPQALNDWRPNRHVGDKVSIHDVNMDDGPASVSCGLDLFRQMGEISRQDRGC